MTELPVFVFTPDLGGLLSLIINLLLPLAVAFITKQVTSSSLKALLLLALAAIKVIVESALRAVMADVPWDFIPVVMNVVISFAVAVAAHYGLWKHTELRQDIQDNRGVK